MELNRSKRLISIAFYFSLGVHVACGALLVLLIQWNPSDKLTKKNWIQVETLPSKTLAPFDKKDKKLIVQTERGEKVAIASADANLGEQNQVFDRQTVSKNKSNQQGSSQGKPTKNYQTSKSLNLSQFGLKWTPPEKQVVQDSNWASPGSRPEDSIPGMKESDRTALNTREFQFYGYFQRIRDRLDRAWVPVLREKLISFYRSGRRLASDMDHVTKVLVVLNGQGEVTKVILLGESGTQELDSAAISAFNQAGPFPNPPRGIVDRDQEVKIPWDFVLKT